MSSQLSHNRDGMIVIFEKIHKPARCFFIIKFRDSVTKWKIILALNTNPSWNLSLRHAQSLGGTDVSGAKNVEIYQFFFTGFTSRHHCWADKFIVFGPLGIIHTTDTIIKNMTI